MLHIATIMTTEPHTWHSLYQIWEKEREILVTKTKRMPMRMRILLWIRQLNTRTRCFCNKAQTAHISYLQEIFEMGKKRLYKAITKKNLVYRDFVHYVPLNTLSAAKWECGKEIDNETSSHRSMHSSLFRGVIIQ